MELKTFTKESKYELKSKTDLKRQYNFFHGTLTRVICQIKGETSTPPHFFSTYHIDPQNDGIYNTNHETFYANPQLSE